MQHKIGGGEDDDGDKGSWGYRYALKLTNDVLKVSQKILPRGKTWWKTRCF